MPYYNLNELENKKIAFVLSGGVVKASAWHLGVSLALDDLGFTFKSNKSSTLDKKPLEISTYVGSSAGSMVSLFLASGFTPNNIINGTLGLHDNSFRPIGYREMFHLRKNPQHALKKVNNNLFDGLPGYVKSVLKPLNSISGFFSTYGLKQYLLNHVLTDNTFESFAPDLFIVATQLDHSRKVIFSKYNYPNPTHDNTSTYYTGVSVADACAASMSVPPFYKPYPIYNKFTSETDYYIDGEIRDTLSSHVAEDHGCDVIINSWTHTPYHFHEEIGSLANYGLPFIAIQSIYLMIQKKIISAIAKRSSDLDIINSVDEYMRGHKFSERDRRNITSILEKKLHFKKNVRVINIFPQANDFELFFSNSFSLNPRTLEHTVKKAYKRTFEVFSEFS